MLPDCFVYEKILVEASEILFENLWLRLLDETSADDTREADVAINEAITANGIAFGLAQHDVPTEATGLAVVHQFAERMVAQGTDYALSPIVTAAHRDFAGGQYGGQFPNLIADAAATP